VLQNACFGNDVFDVGPATLCFSNLLATGFRGFVLDVYWDHLQRQWTPCPVLLGNATGSGPASGTPGSLARVGPYSCSTDLNLPVLLNVLIDYLQNSSNTLAAVMTYMHVNLRAASNLNGTSDVLDGSQVPQASESIGSIVNTNLSSHMYTADSLYSDRQSLNSTWLSGSASSLPDLSYMTLVANDEKRLTTPDGYPSEGFLEFSKRLVFSIGDVDPRLHLYDTDQDYKTFFKSSDLMQRTAVTYGSSGSLLTGCFASENATSVVKSNNSWAVTYDMPHSAISDTSVSFLSNLTSCGISPIINSTLDATADSNILPYQNAVYSSIWSWATGEPRNLSANEYHGPNIRCAAMDLTLNGRWRIVDCAEEHPGACRATNDPYVWMISQSRGPNSSRDKACPPNSTFAVPRTGLENTYLRYAAAKSPEAASDAAIWLNFNSLDVQNCWVSGVGRPCPYGSNQGLTTRKVIIPIVAALVVLLLAALLVFMKCAANRRNYRRGRRRKNADDTGAYEGVPS
jgi:hypothetical protein